MLNGIAPIIIFNFPLKLRGNLVDSVTGIPTEDTRSIIEQVGVPIPIYLDESLTGVYVDTESKAIDIETQVEALQSGFDPKVHQRALNNVVTVNLLASKDSIVLGVLLAMNDYIFSRVASADYQISYLNGATTVFGGLLQSFTTQMGDNDDLIRIQMQISKAKQLGTIPIEKTAVIEKVTGTVPIGGP